MSMEIFLLLLLVSISSNSASSLQDWRTISITNLDQVLSPFGSCTVHVMDYGNHDVPNLRTPIVLTKFFKLPGQRPPLIKTLEHYTCLLHVYVAFQHVGPEAWVWHYYELPKVSFWEERQNK